MTRQPKIGDAVLVYHDAFARRRDLAQGKGPYLGFITEVFKASGAGTGSPSQRFEGIGVGIFVVPNCANPLHVVCVGEPDETFYWEFPR